MLLAHALQLNPGIAVLIVACTLKSTEANGWPTEQTIIAIIVHASSAVMFLGQFDIFLRPNPLKMTSGTHRDANISSNTSSSQPCLISKRLRPLTSNINGHRSTCEQRETALIEEKAVD